MVVGRLAAAQAALGMDVHIVTFACPIQDQVELGHRKSIPHFDLVTIHALPKSTVMGRAIGHTIRQLAQDKVTTIVHIHGVWEPILRHAMQAAYKTHTPYIIAPHGMLHPWSLSQSKFKKKLALLLGYRKLLISATAFHALNSDEATHLRGLGMHQTCHVLPNGVFLNEIEPLPTPGSFITQLADLAGKPYILFLSRLHYKKGLDRLANAFAIVAQKVEHLHLVIAGPDDGDQQRFEQIIDKHQLTNRVHLVGPLWDKSKYAAMQDAACFCLPSRQEGFSVAITEAMAVGVPVVISKACCFDEVAQAGAGYVVDINDANPQQSAELLADALQRVLDTQPNSRMRQAGRQLIKQRYTWPAIAQQSQKVYQQMVGGRHG
jgi:glycosyltransferase involved in cell wall biosynthesis